MAGTTPPLPGAGNKGLRGDRLPGERKTGALAHGRRPEIFSVPSPAAGAVPVDQRETRRSRLPHTGKTTSDQGNHAPRGTMGLQAILCG